ncbi:MAG: hypothetical protein JSS02_15010 [Planctomycetes bacterium]|nr:hypothetical protein [Planctomycetota bacterium]
MAAFVLLSLCVLAPSRAEASCGDYVKVSGQAAMAGHNSVSDVDHGMPDSHDPARPRCHGPNCSNGSFPPVAPSQRLEVRVEQWAIPASAGLALVPEAGVLLVEPGAMVCTGHGLSILRPPR